MNESKNTLDESMNNDNKIENSKDEYNNYIEKKTPNFEETNEKSVKSRRDDNYSKISQEDLEKKSCDFDVKMKLLASQPPADPSTHKSSKSRKHCKTYENQWILKV